DQRHTHAIRRLRRAHQDLTAPRPSRRSPVPIFRLTIAAAICASVALAHATVAAAQPTPPLPPVPPYLPSTDSYPGSYSYLYNVIIAPPPAMVDARGVNIAATVYPGQPLAGQPSSHLGNTPPTE